VTKCSDCGSENRPDAKFCDTCGAKLGLAIAKAGPKGSPQAFEDEGSAGSFDEGGDSAVSFDESEGAVDSGPGEDAEAPGPTTEPEQGIDLLEPEGELSAEPTEAGEDVEEETSDDVAEETPKAGYLVFPDNSEQPIPPSQWLIGRTDLAKFLTDPKKANEISRGHFTVFQEGNRFFVEDGTTMVQRKPSSNKTWLVRNGSRTLVTGTGRNELQDADEIDVAELVKLQFVKK
jgi:hypothetical protein